MMLVDLKLGEVYQGLVYLYEAERNPPMMKAHRHEELEANIVLSGMLSYIICGKKYSFSKGDIIWLFPGQEHQLIQQTVDLQSMVLVFKSDLVKRTCSQKEYAILTRKNPSGIFSRRMDPEAIKQIEQVCQSLMEDNPDADTLNQCLGFGQDASWSYWHGDPDMLNAGLHYLLIRCWKCYLAGKQFGESTILHPSIQKAVDLINDNRTALNLAELAQQSGMSEAYLSRLFKRQMGIAIKDYRNSVRLSRFLEGYGNGLGKTISDAIHDAGFGSYSQFYKCFKKAYGYGPQEYNRQLKSIRS